MQKPYSDSRWRNNPKPIRVDSQCYRCKHYNRDGTCKAFPGGIPKDIILSAFIHDKPYIGDNGVMFEL